MFGRQNDGDERSSLAVKGCSARVHAIAHQGGLPPRRHLESLAVSTGATVLPLSRPHQGAKRLLVWPHPSAFQIRAAESPQNISA
jgi:hypothetical protein